MPDLRREARLLVENPVRQPTPVDALTERVRSRRRRRKMVALSVGVAAAAGLAGGLLATAGGHGQDRRVIVSGPPVTESVEAGKTPAGFVRVNYGDASVAVPSGWTVLAGIESVCPEPNNVVLLGSAETAACSQNARPVASFVRLTRLHTSSRGGRAVQVNGHSGVVDSYRGPGPGAQDYSFPDLGVTIVAAGPIASQIIGSVGWSAAYLVVHPSTPATVPSDWKRIGYDGIDIRVPPTWPVHPLAKSDVNPGVCGPPEFQTPQVFEGNGDSHPGCTVTIPNVMLGVDAVWIHPPQNNTVQSPPSGAQPIKAGDTTVLLIPDTIAPEVQPVLHLLVKPTANAPYVAVDIGLGTHREISQEILASISLSPYSPPSAHHTSETS